MDLLNVDVIKSCLTSQVLTQISTIEIFPSLSSTNTYLMHKAVSGAPSGSICLAEQQTAGRGRHGRIWVSPPSGNIYVSCLWRYNPTPDNLSSLSLVCGVALVRALWQLGVTNISLKWPNDLLLSGRKLGGLLLEIRRDTRGASLIVIGIGLNLHLSLEDTYAISQPWAALDQLPGGIPCTRNHLVAVILNQLIMSLNSFKINGLQPFVKDWIQNDALTGAQVTMTVGEQTITGDYLGIGLDGAMRLANNGKITLYYGGEVQNCIYKR